MYYIKTLVTADEAFTFYRAPMGGCKIPEAEQKTADLELDVMNELQTEPLLHCSVFNEVRRTLKTDSVTTFYEGQKHLVLSAIKRYMLQSGRWAPSKQLHDRAKRLLSTTESECRKAHNRAEAYKLKATLLSYAEQGSAHFGYVTTVAEDDTNEFISKYQITRFRPYLQVEAQQKRKRNDVLRWLFRNFNLCRDVFTPEELAIIDDTKNKAKTVVNLEAAAS
jgi:hypothetical protein